MTDDPKPVDPKPDKPEFTAEQLEAHAVISKAWALAISRTSM